MSICLNRRTDFGRGVKNTFIDFSEHTSAHGIPHIARSKRRKSRIFWTLVFFCCLATFVYMALALFFKYLKFDKTTQIELEFRNAPFPAVTFCNLSPFKASEAAKVDSLNRVISSFNDASAKLAPNDETGNKVPNYRKMVRNRKKRQIRSSTSEEGSKVNRFVPVYAHCNCPSETSPIRTSSPDDGAKYRSRRVDPTIAACTATMNEPNTYDHQCLCIFDKVERKPWLCYDLDHWSKRQCTKCELTAGRRGRCPTGLDSGYAGALASGAVECICPKATTSCLEGLEPYGKLWAMGRNPDEPSPDPPTTTEKKLETAPESGADYSNETYDESGVEDGEYRPIQPDATDVGTIRSQAEDSLIFASANLDAETRRKIGSQPKEFIRFCSFNQRDCFPSDFKSYIDEKFGNCYTFNADAKQIRTSTRAGPMYGLSVVLYINASQYLPTVSGKGVKIAVHSPDEYPFPDTFGYNAPTGFLTSFGMRMKLIERLEWPFKQCVVDGRTDSYIYTGYNYTTEGCFRSCFQSLITKECQCADPKFPAPRGIHRCRFNVSSERICVNKVNEMLGDVRGDFAEKQCPDCIQPCKQTVFDVTFSTAKWPHPASMGAYYKLCEGQVSKDDCEQYLMDNALALEIYYEQLNYERLRESAAYPMANLLADLGGQLGLWLGFSVITIFEFIFLFLNMCRLYAKVKRERRHMRMLMSLSDKSNGGSLAADGKFNNSTVTMTLNMSRVDIPADFLNGASRAPRNSLRDAHGRRYTLRVLSTSIENCDQIPGDSDSNPEVDRRRRDRPPADNDDRERAWRDRAQSQPRNVAADRGAGRSLGPVASVSFSDQTKKGVGNDERDSPSSSSMDSQATAGHRTLNTAARKHLTVKDHRASIPN